LATSTNSRLKSREVGYDIQLSKSRWPRTVNRWRKMSMLVTEIISGGSPRPASVTVSLPCKRLLRNIRQMASVFDKFCQSRSDVSTISRARTLSRARSLPRARSKGYLLGKALPETYRLGKALAETHRRKGRPGSRPAGLRFRPERAGEGAAGRDADSRFKPQGCAGGGMWASTPVPRPPFAPSAS